MQNNNDPYNNKSLVRALEILGCFGFDRLEIGLTELSEMLQLPKATVHRLASTLHFCRFLSRDPDSKRYSLGPKLLELGSVAYSSFSLRQIASPHLKRLNKENLRAILLGVLQDDELFYIDKEENSYPFKFTSEIGRRRPPHFGILGKILMAYLPDREVDRLLEKSPLKPFTEKSITLPHKFKERLQKIREQGYIIEEGETHRGLSGIAAPILDFAGKVIAAVGVTFISGSLDHQTITQIIADTVKIAADISKEAGYHLDIGQ